MSAEVKSSMRVIPSGKVYRQMFDAQVQLTQSLSKGRHEPTIVSREDGIPLIRADSIGTFLNDRQKTWVECFPNDPHTENPVLYKQYKEFVQSKLTVTETEKAGDEVRGLPDVVLPSRTGSDIIDRIAKSRRDRHEAAVEDMRHELCEISAGLEPRIAEAGEMLVNSLQENETEINRILSKMEKDEDLMSYSIEGLEQIWADVQSQSYVRQQWIEELDVTSNMAESDRIMLVREVFVKYAKLLEKTAHLLSPELQKFMDRESQMINQTVLSNKRSYADLFMRLVCADVERERTQHARWLRRVDEWKKLHTDNVIEKFRVYMSSDAVNAPDCIQLLSTLTGAELDTLNSRRVEMIESLRDFRPPAASKSAIYEWNGVLMGISEQIDNLNQQYVNRMKEEHDKVAQTWLTEIVELQRSLLDMKVCTGPESHSLVKEHFLPLVGEKQKQYEAITDEMEKAFEKHNEETRDKLKSLFKYNLGASHMWDIHEIGLAKRERTLQEKLENSRQNHDLQNQDREAALDLVMDRLRQEGSESALGDSLKKALDMLIKIRDSYDVFHHQQSDVVQSYPGMIIQELTSYDDSVCKFFAVDRIHPDDARETEENEEVAISPPTSQRKKKKKSGKFRPESRGSDASLRETPSAPMVVMEVLQTARGTTFYVLTEAADPADKSAEKEGTFLTESEPQKPEYLLMSDLSDDFLMEVKKAVRMNFLDHMEEWKDQAVERANSVVSAKCEELNNELDLRVHLHQPRPRRTELDIHNVRAAELVMHSERVTRHCKGIQQTLSDLKQQFNRLAQEHNKLAQKFRDDIESLETVFVNATKSSKLIALQNQLAIELEKYMGVIRASLRKFRKHLDETLSTLRESNARFIKSFKLFSDGGNFCPEEIDDYHKRLEKMSHKLDGVEGSIMLELEGMESKRLDQATRVAMEFEDRFKSHMFDLLFMEKIARWLTNTQVKIKSEVADSNTQAHKLSRHVKDVERRVDACEKPNLDKEQISPTELNESLKCVFEDFHSRSIYLRCISDCFVPPVIIQGPPALGGRVGFVGEVTPITKTGKQSTEDPSVNIIKSIMKTQKGKMRLGADADLDGDYPLAATPPSESKERAKSVVPGMSRTATQMSFVERSTSKLGCRKETALMSGSTFNLPKRTQSALRRGSKSTKWDRKYLIFGDKAEVGETKHFNGIVKKILREALDGLFTISEVFYKQKGTRPVTRPQALQETFDLCAEVLVRKLQSYFVQAEKYHNQCLQEFRGQLISLEEAVSRIPPLIITEIIQGHITESRSSQEELQSSLSQTLTDLHDKQVDHQNQLRPSLGHPQQASELETLVKAESIRHDDYMQAVNQQVQARQLSLANEAKKFLDKLSCMGESQVLQYDNLLVVDDVLRGNVEPKKFETSELIRRKNAGLPLEEETNKCALPRGRKIWAGLPANEFVLEETIGDKTKRPPQTASVTTSKTTLGHSSTMTARDKAYQEFKMYFQSTLTDIEEKKQTQLTCEERWRESWERSVQSVKDLY